jgi:hypothetical protein
VRIAKLVPVPTGFNMLCQALDAKIEFSAKTEITAGLSDLAKRMPPATARDVLMSLLVRKDHGVLGVPLVEALADIAKKLPLEQQAVVRDQVASELLSQLKQQDYHVHTSVASNCLMALIDVLPPQPAVTIDLLESASWSLQAHFPTTPPKNDLGPDSFRLVKVSESLILVAKRYDDERRTDLLDLIGEHLAAALAADENASITKPEDTSVRRQWVEVLAEALTACPPNTALTSILKVIEVEETTVELFERALMRVVKAMPPRDASALLIQFFETSKNPWGWPSLARVLLVMAESLPAEDGAMVLEKACTHMTGNAANVGTNVLAGRMANIALSELCSGLPPDKQVILTEKPAQILTELIVSSDDPDWPLRQGYNLRALAMLVTRLQMTRRIELLERATNPYIDALARESERDSYMRRASLASHLAVAATSLPSEWEAELLDTVGRDIAEDLLKEKSDHQARYLLKYLRSVLAGLPVDRSMCLTSQLNATSNRGEHHVTFHDFQKLAKRCSLVELADLMKFPFCTGEVRRAFLEQSEQLAGLSTKAVSEAAGTSLIGCVNITRRSIYNSRINPNEWTVKLFRRLYLKLQCDDSFCPGSRTPPWNRWSTKLRFPAPELAPNLDSDSELQCEMIDLGEAESIDQMIAACQNRIGGVQRGLTYGELKSADSSGMWPTVRGLPDAIALAERCGFGFET